MLTLIIIEEDGSETIKCVEYWIEETIIINDFNFSRSVASLERLAESMKQCTVMAANYCEVTREEEDVPQEMPNKIMEQLNARRGLLEQIPERRCRGPTIYMSLTIKNIL